jgi:hypothetical protein
VLRLATALALVEGDLGEGFGFREAPGDEAQVRAQERRDPTHEGLAELLGQTKCGVKW